MYLLAIDTTGPVGGCALLNLETEEILEKTTSEPMSHLRLLASLMDQALREAGARPADLACVAASAGPGSYTGIRIGVTTARTLGQALSIPCLKVPTLDMFRLRAKDRPAAVILNARRGQVYGALFDKGGTTVLDPGPCMLTDVTAAQKQAGLRPVYYGDGIDAYLEDARWGGALREALDQGASLAPAAERYQGAALAARYALPLWRAGRTLDPAALLPDYMRKTEAEVRLADGSLRRAHEEKMKRFLKA